MSYDDSFESVLGTSLIHLRESTHAGELKFKEVEVY